MWRRVHARAATVLHDIEGEDMVVAALEFANGALNSLQASTAIYPGYAPRVEITGSEGTIALEHDRVVMVNLRNPPEEVRPGVPSADSENLTSPVVSDFSGHQAIFEDFIRAIKEDGAPACHGREARRSIALVQEIYRTARKNNFQRARC